jgi:histone deacetylase 1/2
LSSDGFRYFVIFVDAHMKFIWFYPLVAKSDAFAIIHQFQMLVESQFSLKIKSVQTDWGGEYRKLNTYFKTIGIHHRVIYPHTHEQNGMVERRHRHIVETRLTFLEQCQAPLKYWSYAFESSVYLINHMPAPVLNHKTPFECLLKSTLDYAFLRTFGCLCFSLLRPYNAYKLDFRSSPCVFLGYNTSHLGYRCLDLSSKRIYLARHVRFHENVFPFDKSEQIAATPKQPSAPSIPITLHPLTPPSPVPSPLPPTLPTPPSAHLPLSACYYDQSSNAGLDSSHLQSLPINVASSPSFSPASSPVVVVSPTASPLRSAPLLSSSTTGSSSDSPHGINVCVDLSKFNLQHVPAAVFSPSQRARTHPMVLRPRPAKNTNLSIVAASRLTSLPQQEPLSFKDANRYVTWHTAMQDELLALHSNQTWSLVPPPIRL